MVTLHQAIKARNRDLEKIIKNQTYENAKNVRCLNPKISVPKKLEHEYIPALFYCDWLEESGKKYKAIKKSIKNCYPYCCFNHLVGLPTKKYKNENGNQLGESDPIQLWDYEKEIISRYEQTNY